MLNVVIGRERESTPAGRPALATLCFVLLLLGAPGCRTSNSVPPAPAPGTGLRELRSLVLKLQNEVRATTDAVAQLAAASPERRRQGLERFAQRAQHLEVASITARARVEALEKRGQAYFQEWNEEGGGISASYQNLREAQLNQLRPHFDAILADAHQARERFRAFLESVRAVRGASPDITASNLQAAATLTQTTGEAANASLEQFLRTLASAEAALASARSGAPLNYK